MWLLRATRLLADSIIRRRLADPVAALSVTPSCPSVLRAEPFTHAATPWAPRCIGCIITPQKPAREKGLLPAQSSRGLNILRGVPSKTCRVQRYLTRATIEFVESTPLILSLNPPLATTTCDHCQHFSWQLTTVSEDVRGKKLFNSRSLMFMGTTRSYDQQRRHHSAAIQGGLTDSSPNASAAQGPPALGEGVLYAVCQDNQTTA